MTSSRFWVSWVQSTEDFRPLHDPPNEKILGWWCSGEDCEGYAILCACVVGDGDTVGDRMRDATAGILVDWPEAADEDHNPDGWRFFDEKEPEFQPNNRFPLSDWMQERFAVQTS